GQKHRSDPPSARNKTAKGRPPPEKTKSRSSQRVKGRPPADKLTRKRPVYPQAPRFPGSFQSFTSGSPARCSILEICRWFHLGNLPHREIARAGVKLPIQRRHKR